MSPKILRRCNICYNFHASFLVEDPVRGKLYLCFKCAKAWQAEQEKQRKQAGPLGTTLTNTPRRD